MLVTSAENKQSLMAFFKFLVRGAAVSVFHGSEWCGSGSLEFLAGRSEALIYQDVLSVRCAHAKRDPDNRARSPAHTSLCEALLLKCGKDLRSSVTESGSETSFSGIGAATIWKACGRICDCSLQKEVWWERRDHRGEELFCKRECLVKDHLKGLVVKMLTMNLNVSWFGSNKEPLFHLSH